ncbi:MAG: transcription factor S [Candidatus Aenigmarchaeota archaeon]|nr:transcription factor S [Candidatus Aenigmarchaeota archaeon]
MEFCSKCGSIMMPEKGRTSMQLKCRSCGSVMKKPVKAVKITETVGRANNVIVLESDVTTLPITNAKCDKCDNKKAYWWMQQTKGDDEPPTQFFRCTKCKKVWREYK